MSDSNLDGKLEAAFAAAIAADAAVAALDPALAGFTGVEHEEQTLPCYGASCQGGPEEPQGFGNYIKTIEVYVKTKLDQADPADVDEDRTEAHNANVAAVMDFLSRDDLPAKLNAAGIANFYAFDPVTGRTTRHEVVGRTARTVCSLKVYCCSATLS